MKRTTRTGKTYLTALATAAVALSLTAAPTMAEDDKGAITIYKASDKDYQTFNTANGPYDAVSVLEDGDAPGWQYGGLARFTKEKGPLKEWTYWYGEAVYVVSGKGRITASKIPFTSPEEYDVGPGDFTFISAGDRISFEALTDEPFVIFYAAPE